MAEDRTRIAEEHIELLRYILTEVEAGRFDSDEDNLSRGYLLLCGYGAEIGIKVPE